MSSEGRKRRYGRYVVETSREDKVLFPEAGLTKADVMDYYEDAFRWMRPHLEDRFLTLHRFPDGIQAEGFYQQRRPAHLPGFVRGVDAPTADGADTVEHVVADHRAALVALAGIGTVAFHGWLSRCDEPRCPDRIVFDLDPPGDDFDTVIDCARWLREVLQLAGLRAFVSTTGSRGLHVVAPLRGVMDFEASRELARRLAGAVAERFPERCTLEQRKRARGGRLYLDTGRNAYGQTAVLPYSLRALPEAPVATPLDWQELDRADIGPRRYDLGNIRRRMAGIEDPWSGFRRHARRPSLDDGAIACWIESDPG